MTVSEQTIVEQMRRVERLDYERRILAAECEAQRILNLVRSMVSQYRELPYRSADWLAGELMDLADSDVTNPPIPALPVAVKDEALRLADAVRNLWGLSKLHGDSSGTAENLRWLLYGNAEFIANELCGRALSAGGVAPVGEEALIETCELGHKFAKLPDHPRRDGLSRCPYCMAIGLDDARAIIAALRSVV